MRYNAQHLYKANEFANNTRWKWSDWEYSSINIYIDSGQVLVDSSIPQLYTLLDSGHTKRDSNGVSYVFKIIDQDYDRGTLRIREQYDGILQLYIEFSNIKW